MKVKKLRQWIIANLKRQLKNLKQQNRLRSQKKRLRSLKIATTCDKILAWRFFKVLETQDYNYLIDTDELESFNDQLLIPYWDKLTEDYGKKTGDYTYENTLEDFNYDLAEVNKINALTACYYKLLLYEWVKDIDIDNVKSCLELYDIQQNIKADRLKLVIIRCKTDLKINRDQQSNTSRVANKHFEELVVDVENVLKRNIESDKISLAKWIYLAKSAQKISRRHGKGTQHK